MSFADLSVRAFLDALASPEPTPGGGSAAAIAGAMGAALLMMVAGLQKSRTNAESEKKPLADARAAMSSIRERFIVLADEDAAAFNDVMAAYRLSKAAEADKAARKQAIQQAMRRATEAPLETLRAATAAMKLATTIAEHANRAAVSDVRVGLELLETAAAGGTANVDINIGSLEDEAFRKSTMAVLFELTTQLTEDAAAARAGLVTVPQPS